MDIFSYSRQQSGPYKSPRLLNQVSDHNPKTEENEMTKRINQISVGPNPTASRLFQAIIKEAGNNSKDRDSNLVSTSKVLKNVVNRNHLLDSNNTKDYDVEYFIEQGQKLPLIKKKFLPKIDTGKKFDKLSKIEADMYSTHQSLTNKGTKQIMNNSPSPLKQHKDTWRSTVKYVSEEREYHIDGKNGKSLAKIYDNGGIVNPAIAQRTRYSSGGLKFMYNNNLSGGEEEESNGDTLGFSLRISPVKGSQRLGKHLKKKTEVIRQIRAGSPEQKDKSIDYSELRKAKMKIEHQQSVELKKGKKKRKTHKASSSILQENVKRAEVLDKNDTEGSYSKEYDDEEDVEEKKIENETKDEDLTKRKEEKEKAKEKPVPLGLRKGVPSQAAKELKTESTAMIVSKHSKKLGDHILISRVGDKEKESVQMKREQAYKEFMLRLNFSFNIQVKVPTEKTFVAYKYFLGKGNNSMLLKTLMKQRWWWVQVDNKEASDINFMWTQLKQNKFIDGLKQKRKSPFDNLEWSGVSSDCNNGNDTTATTTSFIDSMTDCESDTTEGETKTTVKKARKSQTTQALGKLSSKKDLNEPKKTQEDAVASAHKKLFTNQEIMLMNSMTGGKGNSALYPEDCEEIGRLRKGPSPQVVADPSAMKMCNHLESNYHLANKKALLWNMKSYYEATKQNVFDFLPLTFHVRNGFEDKEYQKFVEYYNNREKEIQEQEKLAQESKEAKKAAKKLRNIWIVKPGENTNRGVGIHVCDSLSQINDLVATTQGNTDGKKRTYLIQQYLDKPLLYNKRKFDIRCYILMTCINGMMKGYWYQDGYIRTASKEFSLKNVTNKFIHLTNDAVQKKAEEYGKFESGNKLSYNEFQKYLDAHHDGNINFATNIYPQIKQLATDAIKGVYGKIDPYRRENSFEVFGLDFMIDTSLRAWLIEVNTNPDINASSPVLTRVIPPMVENALRLTIDQMYPPPAWQTSKKQMLPENLLENNKFELVFDEVEDGPGLRNILQADKGATGDLILEIVAEEEEEDAEEEAKD